MLDFFSTVCENYDDRFPMVNPQTCLLIHEISPRIMIRWNQLTNG
jgi:hypothetical protein